MFFGNHANNIVGWRATLPLHDDPGAELTPVCTSRAAALTVCLRPASTETNTLPQIRELKVSKRSPIDPTLCSRSSPGRPRPTNCSISAVELASAIHHRRRLVTAVDSLPCRLVLASIDRARGAAALLTFQANSVLLRSAIFVAYGLLLCRVRSCGSHAQSAALQELKMPPPFPS